jgi:hypothetical protein
MKLLTLIFFFSALAGTALADKKITYTCYDYHHSNKVDLPYRVKVGPVVSDAFGEKVSKHMSERSDHKYTANYNPWSKAVVFIGCSNQEPSKDETVEAIAEQEKIVKEWILKEGVD